MADHSKIPVAIIGGGAIAPFHAKYILSSPTCSLVAIIDPFPSGQSLAQDVSVAHFNTITDLLSSTSPKPQIYYICTPSGLHVKLALEVLEQAHTTAKVILVEKPISTDSISGQQLLDSATSKGVTIAAGHHRRLHPATTAAKRAITSGRLGKLTAITGSWSLKKNDSYFDVPWRASRAAGGGPIWTNFVHDIDLLHYLVGSHVRRIWVAGVPEHRASEPKSKSDAVEEGAAIMMLFANGVVGTFLVCDNVPGPYSWELTSGENPLYPQAGRPVDCFRIFGTEGTLTVPDGVLWSYAGKEDLAREKGLEVGWNVPLTREVLEVEEGIPFQLQVESLVRVVKGMGRPVCEGVDGLMAVKVCEGVIGALGKGDGLPVDIV